MPSTSWGRKMAWRAGGGGSASARTTTKTFHGTLFLLIIISNADQTGPLVHQFYMSRQLPFSREGRDVGMGMGMGMGIGDWGFYGLGSSMFRTLTAADDVDANRKCQLCAPGTSIIISFGPLWFNSAGSSHNSASMAHGMFWCFGFRLRGSCARS